MTAPSRMVAAIFALAGFAVALVAGLAAGNSSVRVLGAALVSMVVCHILGMAAGAIGERTVNEHLESYRKARPIGSAPERAAGGTGAPGGAQA